jgi:hypothetical protein
MPGGTDPVVAVLHEHFDRARLEGTFGIVKLLCDQLDLVLADIAFHIRECEPSADVHRLILLQRTLFRKCGMSRAILTHFEAYFIGV